MKKYSWITIVVIIILAVKVFYFYSQDSCVIHFIINLSIDYNWFFSTISQSLAALIGIGGLFIVYRLQIQENRINDAVRKLQEYMSFNELGETSHLTKEETLGKVEIQIENILRDIEFQKRAVKANDVRIENKEGDIVYFEGQKAMHLVSIKNGEKTISGLQKKKKEVGGEEKYKVDLQWSAFIAIIFMTFTFFVSSIGLVLSEYFKLNILLGHKHLIRVFILLLGALMLLLLSCAAGLDMGRPRLIEHLRKLKRKLFSKGQ